MRVAILSVSIRGHQTRKEPDEHVAYQVSWEDSSRRSSTVWRRYSEFVDLVRDLTEETGSSPPSSLPPTHRSPLRFWSRPSVTDESLIAERQTGLETFLRALLAHKDSRWRDATCFREFLAVPATQAAPSSSDFTSSTWLDEQEALLTLAKQIRSELSRRDALLAQGDAASRQISVSAKAKLANMLSRLTTLTAGLNALAKTGMAEGELRRRSDMVARLQARRQLIIRSPSAHSGAQDESETLSRLAVASRNASTAGAAARSSARIEEPPDRGRAVLLGDQPRGRVLGSRKPGEETAETRGLDNGGLLQLQQQQLVDQDQRIEQLTAVVRRQRELGVAIGAELAMHNELLDGLSADVDVTNDKLAGTKKQLKKLGS